MSTQQDPVVFVAVLCEKVLREHDAVISLIRMVDRFTVPAGVAENPPGPRSLVLLTVFLAFRAEHFRGNYELRIRHIPPSGEPAAAEQTLSLPFADGQLINNLNISTGVPAHLLGKHSFEVWGGGQVIARLPFTIEEAAVDPSQKSAK